MKKKITYMLATILLVVTMTGCSKKDETPVEPTISQVRNLCNLATLECYYHNVAKSTKEPEAGITHWGEKTRIFWIEYDGIARLGIDMSKVEMKVKGTQVKIHLPEAEVLGIEIDKKSLDESSYIISEDGLNSNEITAQDQISAVNEAQKKMEEEAKANKATLMTAQNRAKTLIGNYIEQLGKTVGVEYQIEWTFDEVK